MPQLSPFHSQLAHLWREHGPYLLQFMTACALGAALGTLAGHLSFPAFYEVLSP